MNTHTRKLHDLGQRIWLDNITREMLNNGTLARYIAELSVTGLTSNPTIFEHAIGSAGARSHCLHWASTGMKDPAAPDTFFVEALAAARTIDAIPEVTLLAFADHGKVGATVPADGGDEEAVQEKSSQPAATATAAARVAGAA